MLPSPLIGRTCKENSSDELHLAVLTGRTRRIKHLLRKGVHIESVNTVGQTSLFCASYGGDYEIVELLLRLGANPNRRCGSRGAAPIHAAAYRGSRRVFRLLVEAGADLTLLDAELQTPRQYAEQQPSPLRRQKILEFFDFLYAMTLHRAAASTLPDSAMSSTGVISEGGSFSGTLRSSSGTLKSQKMKGFLAGSQLSLARKHSQSTASLWSSCISEAPSYPSSDETDSRQTKEVVLTENLHKNISCHLIDQLCVTTSLPLLTPDQLQRPNTLSPAYTCGGPTVYSSYLWLGTPVTVRRPTPALLLNKQGQVTGGNDKGIPDADAVGSLLQELSFLRRLRHPGFLEVMAACHVTDPSPDHVTLVFQHVPYGSLYHHLHVQHHDLSVGNAVDILIGLVEALLFLHVRGWFHCGLSSHALHLVSLGSARLGGFENALEAKVKGVGMRADHLTRAPWLMPWQAPETLAEKMMSVRSEVYSIASIIWEIWSGMPPWAGIEEEEIAKRVGSGEMLPPIKGTQLSLVCYLTQYGLRWNAHERELDLQEVHTMLRSLRIQCNEEERVPAVTSWGPPSIPNTPLICRQKCKCEDVLPLSTSSSSGELRRKTERNYNEIVGIKPASHQLTRHSSSCSLGSGPPSPNHPRPVSAYTVLAASRPNHLTSSHGSLPTSPTHSKFKTVPPAALPLSVFSDPESLLKEATTMGKLPDRRHSETTRYRVRRSRRKHDVEVEEQFIDDEFNSLLYDQPHMQLSVGSAENLLDSRLSFAVVDDSASTGSPSAGQHSCQVTSSDDDEDISRRPASSSLHPLNILEETGDSDNAEGTEGDKKEANQSFITRPYSKSSKRQSNLERSAINQVLIEYASDKLAKTAVAEEDVFLKSGYSGADIIRDYEPLKSIKVMKNLEKSLTSYLPTYSIGSDSD